ncbi:putative FAS1 domain-containing protein [Septoria linicola]|nr:putative FAS1 domain-containing protein [Septoria linicola]
MLTLCLTLLLLTIAPVSVAQNNTSATSSLSEVLAAYANLSSFDTLMREQLPELLKVLDEDHDAEYNPITVLAPSNRALDRIQYNPALNKIWAENDTVAMSRVIGYHILGGKWTSETLDTSFSFLPSMTVGTNFSGVTGGQRVGAVLQNGDPEKGFKSEIVFLSGAAERSVVSIQDIPFAGGIVQVIDNPLNPPAPLVPTAESFNLPNYPFAINSFLGALYSTSDKTLQTYLNETKDITIFVPANVAFETVAGAITTMTNQSRLDLLSYHVLPGSSLPNGGPLYSSDFQNASTLPMHNNQTANMAFYPNSYFLNSARIVQSDVLIHNGVLHVIDVLLDPREKDRVPNPTSATQAPVLPAQTDGANFNVSIAPFTTWLPNYVPTDLPTSTSTRRTSAAPTTSQTGTSSSGAGRTTAVHAAWPSVGAGWALLAVAAATVCLML